MIKAVPSHRHPPAVWGKIRLNAARDVFSIPVRDQERQFGVLIVLNPEPEATAAWQLPLLERCWRA